MVYEWYELCFRYPNDPFLRDCYRPSVIYSTNHISGRTRWLATLSLETFRILLGQEDIKTTIMYLGINMDDKSGAMKQLARYQNALKRGNFDESSKMVDGPGFEPGAS